MLNIFSVFFGRTDTIICVHASGTPTDCIPDDALKKKQIDNVKRLCNNETSCTLKAGKNI